MPGRIVVFGATGYTGRLVAERLAGAGERPVLAGRSEERLRVLAERLGGLDWAKADVMRQNSVFALVSEGDVLLSTVGPFAKWGEPAVRAAIAAKATYVDSTGEPQFVRRVFEQHGPAARSAEVALLTAMGYDFVPGALAGALALRQAGSPAVRVDVGYYSLGGGAGALSSGTKQSLVGASLSDGYAFRAGTLRDVRAAERVRSFRVKGKQRTAVSIGGAEHFTLPAAFPRLREVNVYLGWFRPLARPMQAGTLIGSVVTRLPGVRGALQLAGSRLAGLGGSPEPGTTPGGMSWVAAVAYDAFGEQLAEVHLSGVDGYAFTAEFLAWTARSAAGGRVAGTGAVGPVEAFGLDALERGCRQAGLERVVAPTS
ncbi:MAG TPA: saccharopine dehydrogenase NADP-binding domain-containing protein [Solirubrobacteraceae bacterium]|nr:saccharopine dehydrogenase NADP-binding domain-containing protein [Solirubrobacteraceae bacterium]